jgi:purine nucleosidase
MPASWQASRGTPVVIDTDAGVDDATALLVAFRKHLLGEIALEAITCVVGNCSLADVLANVASTKLVYTEPAIGAVPVFKGAEKALVVEPVKPSKEELFHGTDGLGDTTDRGVRAEQHIDVPEAAPAYGATAMWEAEHAANAIVRLAHAHAGQLLLIALGPLTNIALALRLEPRLPQLVKAFVFMGGTSRGRGNVTPVAEANFHADPEAAAVCLEEFDTSVMLSWECTGDHPLPWKFVDEKFLKVGGPQGRFTAAAWRDIAAKVRGNEAGMLIPDPLAVLAALDLNGREGLVRETERVRATVELGGTSRGAVLVNRMGVAETGDPGVLDPAVRKNLIIITKMDLEGVQRELLKACRSPAAGLEHAVVACECGECALTFFNPVPRNRSECCCRDCRQRVEWAAAQGPGARAFTPQVLNLWYIEDDIIEVRGGEHLREYVLRDPTDTVPGTDTAVSSPFVVAACCSAVLCVPATYYNSNYVAVIEEACTLRAEPRPAQIRYAVEEFPAGAELAPYMGEGVELQKHLFHYRRPAEEGGIGTAAEREYARTFFNRSQLRVRRGESCREVCDRLGVPAQMLRLAEGAAVPPLGKPTKL